MMSFGLCGVITYRPPAGSNGRSIGGTAHQFDKLTHGKDMPTKDKETAKIIQLPQRVGEIPQQPTESEAVLRCMDELLNLEDDELISVYLWLRHNILGLDS
jgi:hypothetical protein